MPRLFSLVKVGAVSVAGFGPFSPTAMASAPVNVTNTYVLEVDGREFASAMGDQLTREIRLKLGIR